MAEHNDAGHRDYVAVIVRLRRGFDWPLPERADGHRYWSRPSTGTWEPMTDGERAAVEAVEAVEAAERNDH